MVGFGYGRKSPTRLDPKAKLPDPKPLAGDDLFGNLKSNSLEVPNQLGPELGGPRLDTIELAQAFPNLVTCPDGTLIDFKTGKVVSNPNRGAAAGEWTKTKVIQPPQILDGGGEYWNESPKSIGGVLSNKDSEQYWKDQAANQPEMSNAQKKLLADLEDGKLMKLSRLELVDESKKPKSI